MNALSVPLKVVIALSIAITVAGQACAETRMPMSYDWSGIQAIEPDRDLSQYLEKAEWWVDLAAKLSEEFASHCTRADAAERMGSLVDEFGKQGTGTDLKLCLLCPELFFPTGKGRPVDHIPENWTLNGHGKEWFRMLQMHICKHQTERFLNDSKFAERYGSVVAYSRQFWGTPEFQLVTLQRVKSRLAENFRPSSEDYWWHAREFVLVVQATGRRDLVQDVEPHELHKRLDEWLLWLDANVARLVAHPHRPMWTLGGADARGGREQEPFNEPELPFNDWDRNDPAPKKEWFEYMMYLGVELGSMSDRESGEVRVDR